MFTVLAVASEGILSRTGRLFNVPNANVTALLVLAGAGGVIVIVFSSLKKPMHAFVTMALLMAALLMFMNVEILPSADSRISARNAARDSIRLNPSGQNVMVFGLTRDLNY